MCQRVLTVLCRFKRRTIKHIILLFEETPRKFITAVNLLTLFCKFIKLSITRAQN